MYTSSKKQGVASKFTTSRGILHIKIGGIKKKKLQNLGVQLITSNPKLPFHSGFRVGSGSKIEAFKRCLIEISKSWMVDVCLTPRVMILTTQRNPKMITFMGDIQEGYIYSQHFLRIHYWYCKMNHPLFSRISIEVGVSENRGTPKWMVYNGKPY